MGAVGLIKVLMLIGVVSNGHVIAQAREVVSAAECSAARKAAEEYNTRFQWFWEKKDREIVVACLEHPGNREA